MAAEQHGRDRSAAPQALRSLEERGQGVTVPLTEIIDVLYGVLDERGDEPARAVVQVIAGHVLAHVEDTPAPAGGHLGPADGGGDSGTGPGAGGGRGEGSGAGGRGAGSGEDSQEARESRSTGGDAPAAGTIEEREAVAEDRDDLFGS